MTRAPTPSASTLLLSCALFGVAAGLASPRAARADEELVELDLEPRNDQQGHRWDLTRHGYVNSGTSYTFARAMVLTIDGAQINPSEALMSPDRTTYVYRGSSKRGASYERRVTLDLERGAARFVDTFRNEGRTPLDLRVKLYTRLGRPCEQVFSNTGREMTDAGLQEDEVGLVAYAENRRPAVAWTIASPRATLRPEFKQSNRQTFEYEFMLRVPARGTRSLVTTLAQVPLTQRPEPAALAQGFAVVTSPDYVADLPPQVRRGLVNFEDVSEGPPETFLSGVEDFVAKHEVERAKHDTVLLGERESMVGTVAGGPLVVESELGRAEVPLAEVLLWRGGSHVGHPQLIVLENAEVLPGRISAAGLVLRTPAGVELPLAPQGFLGLVRQRSEPPLEPTEGVYLETHGGARLKVAPPSGRLTGITPWGPLDCDLSEVTELSYGGKDYPGLVATLRDGTSLPFTLANETLRFESLRLGALELPGYRLRRLRVLSVQPRTLVRQDQVLASHAELSGGGVLVGELELTELRLRAATGMAAIEPRRVRELRRLVDEDEPSREVRFELVLDDGVRVEGRLEPERLPIRTARGLREVPQADLVRYRQAPPPAKVDPAPGPTPVPTPQAPSDPQTPGDDF